jgi:cell division transport system permease protein
MVKVLRAFKTALQYMIRNFGLSFASVVVMTLSFFIVSIVGLAFYGSYKLVKYVDSKPALTIFLRGDLDVAKAERFAEIVNGTGLAREVKVNDIDFSKDDLVTKFPDLAGTITEDNKTVLPVITFVYGTSQDNLGQLIKVLEGNQEFMDSLVDRKNIDKVGWYKFNSDQADVIRDANKLLRTSGIAITLFLFVISSVLIFITVKLTIHYHHRELEIMDLVGAEGWFIRLPFVIDGIVYGVLGGLFSTGIIFLFKNFIIQRSQGLVPKLSVFFSEIQWPNLDTAMILKLFLITCSIGAVVGAVSSFLAIIRYVKK